MFNMAELNYHSVNDYRLAWICALSLELAAAKAICLISTLLYVLIGRPSILLNCRTYVPYKVVLDRENQEESKS